jgi:hypothetical protein
MTQLLPDNIRREMCIIKFLFDYTSSAIWNTEAPFGKLHQELMRVLEPHEIVAYHNTRLPDKKSIENYGLIFSDDRYTDMLQVTLEDVNIVQSLIDEIMDVVTHERDRWESGDWNRRKNEVCFIYDMDYYKDYDKFLTVYGGKFMEFGLSAHTGNRPLSKYRDIIKIGHPYVVEFAIPFNWMQQFGKQDVARFMMEEWIHLDIRKDEVAHQYDGRIEHEIPANKIIEVHEVDDNFPEMDEWLFRED